MKTILLLVLHSVEAIFNLNNAIKDEKRVIFCKLSMVAFSIGVIDLHTVAVAIGHSSLTGFKITFFPLVIKMT